MTDPITVFAKTNFRNQGQRFGIKQDDRRRHMYVIGKTGMGKSVLLENMVYSDVVNGSGVCYVDPHGDTAEKIIDCIPPERMKDVIYINPADIEHPVAFNVLEQVEPRHRHLVASGLVGVFKKIWADSWGPRLEYLLRNTILALLDFPESTLLGVNRMLIDNDYRKKVIAKIQDPVIKAFWVDEFSKYNQQFLTEAIAPIQNKVGQFLSTSLIRNIVGQTHSSIDLRKAMDSKKIIILNLSKGRIGEDASSLLGAMIITKIQLAAMSRVDIPEDERNDFYLYVDEFQNFATESFANILSEARKYRLNLTIAHQYIEQLGEVVKPAVFGNVGTIICFRVGAEDADFLVKEFTPKFIEEDLVNLPKFTIYLKLMINGVASAPFSASTLPPISKETHSTDEVIRFTRENYTSPADDVEDKIATWSGVETEAMVEKLERDLIAKQLKEVTDKKIDFLSQLNAEKEPEAEEEKKPEEKAPVSSPSSTPARSSRPPARTNAPARRVEPKREERKPEAKKEPKPEREKPKTADGEEVINIVTCDSCGQKTKINFNPNPDKPLFCKECLKDHRREQSKADTVTKKAEEAAEKRQGRSRDPRGDKKSSDELSLGDLKRTE
jgi:CxxC-x17-CxxC domain-containing protein